MKKYASFILLLSVMALCSCNGAENKNDRAGKSEEKTDASAGLKDRIAKDVDTVCLHFKSSFPMDTLVAESPAMSIDITLPMVEGDNSRADLINQEILYVAFDSEIGTPEERMEMYVDYLKDEYYSYYPDYVDSKNMYDSFPWLNHSYEIKGEFIPSREGTLCYKLQKVSFGGGAHGMESTQYLMFDSNSGKPIGLDDIFKDGYSEQLCNNLVDALARKLSVEGIDAVKKMGYLYNMDMYVTGNFRMDNDSIIFHYNRYEIAPYSFGETEIVLGLNELEEIMK